MSDGTLIRHGQSNAQPTNQIAISSSGNDREKGLIRTVNRTSNLEAPIISLAGAHSVKTLPLARRTEAFVCQFDFRSVATDSHSKAPILDLHWSLIQPLLYSVSADFLLSFTDVKSGQRVRKITAHRGIINSLDRTVAGGAGNELVLTGSDDGTVKIWEGGDEGGKHSVGVLEVGCPVTSVCWGPDGTNIYVGALDNEIHVFDVRKNEKIHTLSGHTDTPSSLTISPNGQYLLSPSFSSQVIIHDIRPFSPLPNRVYRTLHGAPAGYENTLLKAAWSKDDGGQRVAVGGADRMVCVWSVETGKVLYKLPGHKGTVTCVDFHPKEPIILTGSKDGTMLLGELDPNLVI